MAITYYTQPAPKRLAKILSDAAFDVALVITRRDSSTADPDALVPAVDAPISAQDQKDIKALLALYEVDDKGDPGPKLAPP